MAAGTAAPAAVAAAPAAVAAGTAAGTAAPAAVTAAPAAVTAGTAESPEKLARAQREMRRGRIDLAIDLGLGRGSETLLTCDLSVDYVKENSEYTT